MKIIIRTVLQLACIFSVLFSAQAVAADHVDQAISQGAMAALARQLGFVTAPYENNCGGYYVEPVLDKSGQPILPPKQSQTTISAAYGSFSRKGKSVLRGNVVVLQPGRRLEADKAIVYRNPKTGKITNIDLYGNVHAYSHGKLVIGDKAHLRLDNKSGTIDNVVYRVVLAQTANLPAVQEPISKHKVKLVGTTAWGRAKQARQIKPGLTEFRDVSYTTCSPNTKQWSVKANRLKLNKKTGWGAAYGAWLRVAGVPLLYVPYFNFPIDYRRKTGFLYPTIGYSNLNGAEFSLPFYWNIAPNYDATITPVLYSKRGVLMKGQFRYLTHYGFGRVRIGILPEDQAFKRFQRNARGDSQFRSQFGLPALLRASRTRQYYNWENFNQFGPHVSAHVDYSNVSDDYYFQDFGNVPELFSINQLRREASVRYADDHWVALLEVQNYKTLHPVNRQPIGNLYSRRPEFVLNGNYPDELHLFDLSLHSQATYFTRAPGPGEIRQPVEGGRLHIAPGISMPLNWVWGYFDPSVHFDATRYILQNQRPGFAPNITRTIPIVALDTGVYFDRDVNIFGHGYVQTLEPRIYYVYIPFRNQSQIPIFDTAIIPFTYDQLFRSNRFSGLDRIGDTNQVTLALSTRFIDQDTGAVKLTAGVGQIYYFHQRRVNGCNTPGCVARQVGFTSNTEDTSPIAAQLTYYFNSSWSVTGQGAWDLNIGKAISGDFYFQYHPTPKYLFNIGYYYLRNGDIIANVPIGSPRNNLNQVSASYATPIFGNWSTVGLFTYNISQNHPQTYLFGVQYDTCCWAFRVVGGRTFTALDQLGRPQFNTGVYVQLELKGLANFDPGNVSSRLTNQIRGYVDPLSANRTFF